MDPKTRALHAGPWDGFLVGPHNALAYASAIALTQGQEPVALTPLVIYGPSGAGKSRLLAGLVAEFVGRRPHSAIVHQDAEAFATTCAQLARVSSPAEIRVRFRGVDLFVLEDVYTLDRAPRILQELGHTFDALDETGALVVLSARTAPPQWVSWPRRVVTRVLAGLAVRVDLPDVLTRRRYLLDRARARGISLSSDTVEALVETAEEFRALDGLLARLVLDTRVTRYTTASADLSAALPERCRTSQPVTVDAVARAIAGYFGIRVSDLRSESRVSAVVLPRHLAMALVREWTGLSYAVIGAYFGGRDPATVRHACRAAAAHRAQDPALSAAMAALTQDWRRPNIDQAME